MLSANFKPKKLRHRAVPLSDINISQDSVMMRLRCGESLMIALLQISYTECASERLLVAIW